MTTDQTPAPALDPRDIIAARPTLVASDVDGTLIDDQHRISARTREAVQGIVASGTPFVLATGRPPRWIGEVVEQLGVAPLAVSANGAVLYDPNTDRLLDVANLDTDTMAWLAELVERVLPGAGLAAERVGESAHDAASPQFVSTPDYAHAWLIPESVELSTEEVLATPAIKLLARMPGMSSHEMAERLRPHLHGRADLTYSTDNGLVEFSAPGVTKASGLAALAQRVGFDTARVTAFGDMLNDVPMLTMASLGVAVDNAHPIAKAAADEVTTANVDDGVARVLERWLTA